MSSNSVSRILQAMGAISLLSAAPLPASGQAANERQASLDAIVVTGERIERSLRNTASSVTPITEDDIAEQTNHASVADLIANVPNVLYPDTVSAPVIRGQDTQGPNFGASAFLGGTVPRATFNLDGRNLSYNELVFGAESLWDVDSIEVFRGPQTVAQGANSIAGAVTVRTKDPVFTPEGAAQLQAGSHGMKRASLAVSGPLVDNQLAARIALDYHGRNTFIDYVNPAFARGDSDQDFSSKNARIKLLWTPEALPGLEAKLTFAHQSSNRPTSEAASAPYDDYESRTASMPSFKLRGNTYVGDVSYRFDNGMRLSNQVQFTDLTVHRVTDPYDNGGALITQRNVSNETRLSFGDQASRWSGVVGLFYNRTRSDETLHTLGRTGVGISAFDDKKENIGLFTELTRRLSDRWRLTAGLRYQRDHIQRSGTTPYTLTPLRYDETFRKLLPRLSLAYDITPNATVGALVSKGYNPGGVGLSFARASYMEFQPESVWNYELFGRTSLLDGRMTLTSNVFYSDYRDSQRLLPDYLNGVLYGAVVVNAEKASAYGMELSMDYQALDTLRIRSGIGLLHTRIRSFTANGGVLEGKTFGRAPKAMLSLGVDWDIHPQWRLAANVRHTAGYHSTDENIAAYDIGSYTMADARITYAPTRSLEIFAYVNNLFDKRTPTWKYDDRTAGGIAASMTAPRQFGVGVKATF